MKILELGKFYPPVRGGIETLIRNCCDGFSAAGDDVECVVANVAPRSTRERADGVTVHRLASFGSALSVPLCPQYPLASQRFRADVIHAHTPNPLADLACVLAPRGVPVVLSWHSDIIRQRAALNAYRPLQHAVLRRADRIVVATPNHLEFSSWLPTYHHKVEVIPYGLDLTALAEERVDAARVTNLRRSAAGRSVLLNVGRLVGYKGQRYAIEALRSLPNAELWLVGTGPLEGELRSLSARANVADRVVFCGDVSDDDLPCYLHACDIFVFPSVSPNEAFGVAQVEAMACGKPVVACNLRSGVPWVCADGVTGLTVPARDSAALARALGQLVRDEALRRKLGDAARKRAWSEFAKPTMVARYRDLFAELTRARRRAPEPAQARP